jgi:hypothetical protein
MSPARARATRVQESEAERGPSRKPGVAGLRIGAQNDAFERDADRVANAVTSGSRIPNWSFGKVQTGLVQRQPAPEPPTNQPTPAPQPNNYKEGAEKLGEAFLATDLGKELKKAASDDPLVKGAADFIGTLPGKIIAGAAAAGAVSALAATHTPLPVQIPEIPLDKIRPGLKVKITYEGPVDHPTKAMVTFSYTPQGDKKKPEQTSSERSHAEAARMAVDMEKFRAGLKYVPGSPQAQQQEADQKMMEDWMAHRFGSLPGTGGRPLAPGASQPSAGGLQLPEFQSPFALKAHSLLDKKLELQPLVSPSAAAQPDSDTKKPDELPVQRKAENNAAAVEDPDGVDEVLHSPGRPLDRKTRRVMESRMGFDFSKVRVHTDSKAAESASGMGALAYASGTHVVFGAGRYAPQAAEGKLLLAHELAHVVQQQGVEASGTMPLSRPGHESEKRADATAHAVMNGQTLPDPGRTGPMIARQAANTQKNAETENDEEQPKDTFAGTTITEVIVSLARKRVAFRWSGGAIMGNIKTDLKPGQYTLRPDVANMKWVIEKPAVKAGVRFDVYLEGAKPWTLAYPETLPLTVVTGSKKEPKTFGDMIQGDQVTDPTWLYEGWSVKPGDTKEKPVTNLDAFVTANYDLDYRSEKTNASKWITLTFPGGVRTDINIDTITDSTPRLMTAKKAVLKIIDDYNTLFIIAALPAVLFIISVMPLPIAEGASGGGGARYKAVTRQVPKGGGGEPEVGGGKTGGAGGEPPSTGGTRSQTGEATPGGTDESLKASGKTTPGSRGNRAASAQSLASREAAEEPGAPLPAKQQQIADELIKEHGSPLNPEVAKDAARGGASAAGSGGKGADVPLLNGGGREVSVHQTNTPFTAESVGSHLQQEAMQQGTTEIYLQINSTGATREGFLKMLPQIRNGYLELRGITVKIFGSDGSVWWNGVFGGPKQ